MAEIKEHCIELSANPSTTAETQCSWYRRCEKLSKMIQLNTRTYGRLMGMNRSLGKFWPLRAACTHRGHTSVFIEKINLKVQNVTKHNLERNVFQGRSLSTVCSAGTRFREPGLLVVAVQVVAEQLVTHRADPWLMTATSRLVIA